VRPSAALLGAITLAIGVGASDTPDSSIEAAVIDAMDKHGVRGVGVAVIEDFEVTWAGSFGEAEPGRPVEADTLFQAASLSKPVAAVAAAAAAEEGLFDLETDSFDLLTSWRHPPMPYDGPVTLRMLFAHRGGANVPGFPGYRLDERLPELREILDGVRDKNEPIRIVAEPGEDYDYSGGGYLIAQLAIEDHTGIAWEDLADRYVFEPLGMELSTYRLLTAPDRDRVAVGYRIDGSEVAGGGWHLYPETAPASVWTTPTEYAAFVADVMRSHEDGSGVVLDQDTARLLLDPDFAVGFWVEREPGGISMRHAGANEGYRCEAVAVPYLGSGIVVMTNGDAGLDLTDDVVDAAAGYFGWPGSGWSTPLWMVLVGLGLLVSAAASAVRWLRRARDRRADRG
jgi:CubicO group peptidase (beta-lactamase class C family)